LNAHGYLTLASDFRGWGQSDDAPNFFWTGPVIDSLNAISALESVPAADTSRVGMWGHSMGGGATTDAIAIDPRINAAVIYAPTRADKMASRRWWRVPPVDKEFYDLYWGKAYYDARHDYRFLTKASPINYMHLVEMPIQIHIGSADTMCPPEWSEEIRDALQEAGKEVEYFTYIGQGHALHSEHWELFMQRVTEFYNQYIKLEGINNDTETQP